MLIISGKRAARGQLHILKFQSRNRDAYHFRTPRRTRGYHTRHFVSISQSRCLSFQDAERAETPTPGTGFNLAIEMLIISGQRDSRASHGDRGVSISQSRCLSFQANGALTPMPGSGVVSISQSRCLSFQDGGHSRVRRPSRLRFQSRNRDACHFRPILELPAAADGQFQSRNRDACHFRIPSRCCIYYIISSFNLAIEMLVISGSPVRASITAQQALFQSRNRDACHFRPRLGKQAYRCLFQFQSRNRDACHFRAHPRSNDDTLRWFQSRNRDACHFRTVGASWGLIVAMFQSRNRDACHFRAYPPRLAGH